GPFVGKGGGEVLAMHIYEQPPRLRDLVPVSDEVDELAARLLRKSPEERASEVNEVAELLSALAPVVARRARKRGAASFPGVASSDAPTVVATSGSFPMPAPPEMPSPGRPAAASSRAGHSLWFWLLVVALAVIAGV